MRKTYVAREWRCNMEQKRQHAAVKLDLCIHFKRDYFKKPTPGKGTEVTYNIKQVRTQRELR